MPLGVDNFVQENTGTDAGGDTSLTVTLPSGTTAGNTVVVVVSCGGSVTGTGFTLDKISNSNLSVLRKSDVPASETSWTFTVASAGLAAWYAVELSNVDPVEPLDASATGSNVGLGNGGTLSTGTTPLNAGLSTILLAAWAIPSPTVGDTISWSGYTNDFTEVADIGGTDVAALAVARSFTDGSTGTFSSTATLSKALGGTANVAAVIVAYRAADAPMVAPLAMLTGFEWGTHGGYTSTTGDAAMLGQPTNTGTGTWGTNYLIQASSARNSSYGLRVVQSAGAGYVRMGNLGGAAVAVGFNVRVVSATGTVVVAFIGNQIASTVHAQVLYDATNSQFGVRCGTTGTVSWQSGTTAMNTWVWIDLRVKTNSSTYHADWRVETAAGTYTDQAAAELTGQTAGSVMYSLHFGGASAQTVTLDVDDAVMSRFYAAYPFGPHEVRLLTVDPAGTPTVSGTSANFKVFTANGTLATWDPTAARNAVDEVPPTISAAADGVAQVTTAATDYMEFPMATYTLGPTEFINGVRMLAPLWSGTGAGAGDLAIRGWDGTTETALATASQITPGSPTAVSSTAPVWRCAMWQSTNGWTQAELDNAALRIGWAEATPDMGVEALYIEAAIGKTKTQPLFGTMASAEVDPTRLGAVSVTMAAPDAGGDSSLYYEESGSPTTVPVTGGTTTTQQLNATFEPDTNYVAAYWPPEGVPDA